MSDKKVTHKELNSKRRKQLDLKLANDLSTYFSKYIQNISMDIIKSSTSPIIIETKIKAIMRYVKFIRMVTIRICFGEKVEKKEPCSH
jgi:cystathionine beta-lyase family protein involved in aluminum resistance